MPSQTPAPYAITVFGIPHVMGYMKTRGGEVCASPLSLEGLMDLAVTSGLAGVEFPIPFEDAAALDRLREALSRRRLGLVADYLTVIDRDIEHCHAYLRAAASLGVRVVRSTLSHVLCGDRRQLEGGWEARLQAVAERLRAVLPLAEDLGLAIAMENHQDATTEDLLRLAEMVHFSPSFGITLDAGNPLAVGQDPVDAARQLAPLIRHIHLKDYTIHFAPEGYRLVRCAAGAGVVDFPAILQIVRANGHDVLPGIEIGAQSTRTIPLLEESWWSHYPDRPATALLASLRILWEKGRPAYEPYSSAWERGEDSATVIADEWRVLHESIQYFRALG